MTRCASAALGCLLIVFFSLPVCSGEELDGRWEGTLTFRDAVWRIRMEFARDGGALSATLDLPDMVMAWEPLTVVGEEPVVRVQLPFGVGEFELLPADGGIRSTQTFGDDETMTLELVRAGKAPYQREEIFIESAGARLAGTLLLPRGKDRWPGIVLLHGSGVGDRTRWEYRSWADFYARRGIATLIYDRRGQGESTGSLNGDQHFEMLATDAIAAVDYLSRRVEIDSGRIGLAGESQGAWVAPLAAAGNELVSWMILRSAPAVTPAEQEIQRVVHTMRAAELDEPSIQSALAYMRLYFYSAHTGEGWEELQRAIERGGEATWLTYVDQPERPDQLQWWRNHLDFDPAAVLPRLDIPVLAFYGERDNVVPFARNEGLLRQYLEKGGAELTVKRFLRADHRLETPMGRDDSGRWDWPRIAPGLFTAVDEWLSALVTKPRNEPTRSRAGG